MYNITNKISKQKSKGFTLIELIVVIVILAILAAVALPRLLNLQREARIAKLNAARGSVAAATELVHATAIARQGIADADNCPADNLKADNALSGLGSVCTEHGVVKIKDAYPQITVADGGGILTAAGLTGTFAPTDEQLNAEGYTYAYNSNFTTATFGVTGATDPSNCYFTYTAPVRSGAAPIISAVVISGC